ncbi:unnamed protein product [Caenorhabditis auriculariae]|uniref:Uncharacterized protein n=1 Tax=Caenorhabditis auriculariae TaxID=2777116 RepID=A0A8S1H909_9PELO|nr:unnamed protein product [Caenorhabditis auriculariae]
MSRWRTSVALFLAFLSLSNGQYNQQPTASSSGFGYYAKVDTNSNGGSNTANLNPYANLQFGDFRTRNEGNGQQQQPQQQQNDRSSNYGGTGGSLGFEGGSSQQQLLQEQGYMQQQQPQNRGLFNQALTPYNNSGSMQNRMVNGGVTIQFQLRGYANPSSILPNGNTCVCPPGHNCAYLKSTPRCYISFTFIISCPDESVRYLATDFVYLDQSGALPMSSQSVWNQNYVVQLPTKPSAIDVFAHHLGAVFDSKSGNPVAVGDRLVHVDTFVVPLLDSLPAVDGVQNMNQQRTYQGKLLGTSLSLAYSISCSGSLIGPSCDLSCTKSPINSNAAACRSNATGFFSVCNYINNGQVDNCKNCPWGIREQTYCQDEDGSVLDPHNAGVVDTSYKTATIVLSIIVFFLLICCILSLVMACIQKMKKPKEKEMKTFVRSEDRQPLQATYRSRDESSPRQAMMPPPADARPINPNRFTVV